MKAEFKSSLLIAVMVLLFSSCSNDWGHTDPPAGNQVYPTMEKLVTYAFDSDEELDPLVFNLKSYPEGQLPAIVEDEIATSPVLSLDGGYVRMVNPWTLKESQTAASMTFWMKQVRKPVADTEAQADGDGEVQLEPQDISSPLFHWENENATSTLDFSANGWWKYKGVDGSWEVNNPAEFATGYITPDEWHYVALVVRDDSYGIYVDGEKKVDAPASGDISNVVKFIANAPYFFINYGADTHTSFMIEDLTIYRNSISAKEIAKPKKGNIGGGGSGEEGPDLSKWIMVGDEENSAGFWQVFSTPVGLKGDGTIHYEFYNYTAGTNNWENWVLVLTNNGGMSTGGDSELVVFRADNYGWGALYENNAVLNCDYNWDTFKEDMNGAYVSIDIVRSGTDVVITAVTTTAAGKTYNYKMEVPGVTVENMGTFFTLEKAHLLFNPDATFVGRTYSNEEFTLGNKDKTSGFWTCWTPVEVFNEDFTNFGFEFINHHGGSNWQGWNFVITNGKQAPDSGDGYAEQLFLRCDNYGWASLYDGCERTCNFDWTTYIDDMTDAKCRVYFKTDASGQFTMVARQTTADGRAMPEYRCKGDGFTFPLGIIFTCEGSWLDFSKVGYFPWVDMEPQQ